MFPFLVFRRNLAVICSVHRKKMLGLALWCVLSAVLVSPCLAQGRGWPGTPAARVTEGVGRVTELLEAAETLSVQETRPLLGAAVHHLRRLHGAVDLGQDLGATSVLGKRPAEDGGALASPADRARQRMRISRLVHEGPASGQAVSGRPSGTAMRLVSCSLGRPGTQTFRGRPGTGAAAAAAAVETGQLVGNFQGPQLAALGAAGLGAASRFAPPGLASAASAPNIVPCDVPTLVAKAQRTLDMWSKLSTVDSAHFVPRQSARILATHLSTAALCGYVGRWPLGKLMSFMEVLTQAERAAMAAHVERLVSSARSAQAVTPSTTAVSALSALTAFSAEPRAMLCVDPMLGTSRPSVGGAVAGGPASQAAVFGGSGIDAGHPGQAGPRGLRMRPSAPSGTHRPIVHRASLNRASGSGSGTDIHKSAKSMILESRRIVQRLAPLRFVAPLRSVPEKCETSSGVSAISTLTPPRKGNLQFARKILVAWCVPILVCADPPFFYLGLSRVELRVAEGSRTKVPGLRSTFHEI